MVVVLVQMLLAEQGRQYPHGWVDPAAQSAGPKGTAASSSLLRSRAAAVAALSPARAGGGGGLGGEGGAGSLMEGTLAFLAAASAAADP